MKRILIVEDDVPTCLGLSDFLGELGFETGVAGDGIKALECLAEANPLPDVILLDLHMPNMDGWTLREKLSADERYRNIPIIVMSANQAAPEVPADGCLLKPFDPTDMTGLLYKLFTN